MARRFSYSSSRRAGFTLVELLVVIGIIGLLVSILVPALGKARDRANSVKCASNIRQLYLACLMSAQDHKGQLPRPCLVGDLTNSRGGGGAANDVCAWTHKTGAGVADFETGVLWPYLGGLAARRQVIKCPSDSGEKLFGHPITAERNYSYSMNANIRSRLEDKTGPFLPGIRLNSVANGAKRIMWFEELAPNDTWCIFYQSGDDKPSARHGSRNALNALRLESGWQSLAYLNEGRGNHAFFDGHVASLTPGEMYNTRNKIGEDVYGPLQAGVPVW